MPLFRTKAVFAFVLLVWQAPSTAEDIDIFACTAQNRDPAVKALDATFVSPSLPVDAKHPGTFLNQVYLGVFRPDATRGLRWLGNLKRYQFKATVDGAGFALELVDAEQNPAIDPMTGFIAGCRYRAVRSFWTPTSPDTYWRFDPRGECMASAESNTPDGKLVEKGAMAGQLRAADASARKVMTCDAASCNGLAPFDTANAAITAAALGTAANNAAARDALIDWIRGSNVLDEGGKGDAVSVTRPSVHGDVVHARPVAIDYGSGVGVVVFYGANDGMLRAINGNKAASDRTPLGESAAAISGVSPGGELWSFVAPEHYGRFKPLHDNSQALTIPSGGDGVTGKPYFFDGPVSVLQVPGPPDQVWLFAAQRRGGRLIYAFDVSAPASPVLKWRIGCPSPTGDAGCSSSGYHAAESGGIGQTWSEPTVFKAAPGGQGDLANLLIFGAGYDPCEDIDNGTNNHACPAQPRGSALYIVNPDDGALVRTFATVRSVVGKIAVATDANGVATYAYAADTGGNVYRIEVSPAAAASNWTLTRIAALGCSGPTGCNANRKFLFGPEVVVTPDFNAVLLGSGDREHPLQSNGATRSVSNKFFMLRDRPRVPGWLTTESTTCAGQSLLCLDSLATMTNDGTAVNAADLLNKKGWAMTLSPGEQVVTSSVVLFGEASFSTALAVSPGGCADEPGEARVYNVNYLDGSAVSSGHGGLPYQPVAGGGLPASPVSGLVAVLNPATGQPMTVPFIIGASADSPLEVQIKTGSVSAASSKSRVYWYIVE